MIEAIRDNGKTIMKLGSMTVKFKDMNRHGYNKLRKAIATFEDTLAEAMLKSKNNGCSQGMLETDRVREK